MKLKFIRPAFLLSNLISVILLLGLPGVSNGGSFAARISPPNFELKAKPGQTVREIITIENTDIEKAIYQFRTADWDLNDKGGVDLSSPDQPLVASSCRPWTRIERRKLALSPRSVKRYRFEVHVPKDAENGECRFAIVISPAPETVESMSMGNLNVPVAGAIAVIVYVTIGDAKPELSFEGAMRIEKNQQKIPVIRLHNTGNAHARPFGYMTCIDVNGKKAELSIVSFPILPGQTTNIQLAVDPEFSGIQDMSELVFPLKLKGRIEWEGGTRKIETTMQ